MQRQSFFHFSVIFIFSPSFISSKPTPFLFVHSSFSFLRILLSILRHFNLFLVSPPPFSFLSPKFNFFFPLLPNYFVPLNYSLHPFIFSIFLISFSKRHSEIPKLAETRTHENSSKIYHLYLIQLSESQTDRKKYLTEEDGETQTAHKQNGNENDTHIHNLQSRSRL